MTASFAGKGWRRTSPLNDRRVLFVLFLPEQVFDCLELSGRGLQGLDLLAQLRLQCLLFAKNFVNILQDVPPTGNLRLGWL